MKIYEIQIPRSINEDLWEWSHTHLFTYRLWLLLCYNDRAENSRQIPYGLQSLRRVLSGPF